MPNQPTVFDVLLESPTEIDIAKYGKYREKMANALESTDGTTVNELLEVMAVFDAILAEITAAKSTNA